MNNLNRMYYQFKKLSDMPKVSVIIPAYNAMKYLPATLGSLLSQTFDDFEAIVVNDGSFDETEKWVSQIEDPRVKLICQQNKGLAGARNTGINQATGEYIAFLDADDLWEPSKLEKQVAVLEENPEVGLVYTWGSFS
nr:glycosyltransferase family A protein [Chroococcidiopsis sp. CCNUC1]